MKYLKSIITKFLPKPLHKPMGRWAPDNCDTKTNIKVDFSNEDHCGPCGKNDLFYTPEDHKPPPKEVVFSSNVTIQGESTSKPSSV